MSEVKLYSYVTSPFAAKVHCYLLYKKIDFEVVYVNPVYLKKELPVGRQIPVLQVDRENVVDSERIARYLEKNYKDHNRPMIPERYLAEIEEQEQWINQQFIPVIFQTVRPSFSSPEIFKFINAWKLSNCYPASCHGELPWYVRVLWPYFLNRAHFIRMPARTMQKQGNSSENRRQLLEQLEEKLSLQDFLVTPDMETLPDISLWPLLVVPYTLGLQRSDDIIQYPGIMAWLMRLSSHFKDTGLPSLIPEKLVKRDTFLLSLCLTLLSAYFDDILKHA